MDVWKSKIFSHKIPIKFFQGMLSNPFQVNRDDHPTIFPQRFTRKFAPNGNHAGGRASLDVVVEWN